MTTRPRIILTIIGLALSATTASAQQSRPYDSSRNCDFGYPGSASSRYEDYRANDRQYEPASYQDGFSEFGRRASDRFDHEINRLRHGYDYRAPLDSMVDDTFRTPGYRSNDDLYRSNRNFGSDYRTDGRNRGQLRDPFRQPDADDFRNYRDDFNTNRQNYRPRYQSEDRYRTPYRPVDYSNFDRDYRPGSFDSYDSFGPSDRDFMYPDRTPQPRDNDSVRPGLDPFTPALPRRESGSESEAIDQALSARYGNPVNVRAVQAMSGSQAMSLYREVSQQTDQRHLEPSSYDLRVRRGLRNLALALENSTFNAAFSLRSDSFQMDGFRSSLTRMADGMQVSGYSDAERVVQTVMQQAQNVGIPANVVAFEFASATVDTLDKFSALEPAEPGRGASLPATDSVTRSAMLEGEIVGIGVEVKVHDEGLLINKALRGGPAADARLQSGDIITAIDGRNIAGMSMANSVDLMKGSEGSRIQLRILRDGSRTGTVALTRRRVRVYTVDDVRKLSGTDSVAYISLNQFGQKSTAELDEALQQMYNQGMKSLILDLRGNPGGLLNVCVDITNRFLPCGTIVSTKGRLSSDNMIETASYSRTWSTPLVVLIDEDSASASEIFAAAVQDNRRGIIVGEKSYGKGTVQTHFPLNTVNGNLRLTTARFYSPNGRPMTGQGVTPDVRVQDDDGPANGDRVLAEAIRIAQSQQLKDIAKAAEQCRPKTGQQKLRNSVKGDIYDSVAPKTVLR